MPLAGGQRGSIAFRGSEGGAPGYENAPNARAVVSGTNGQPSAIEKDLEPGAEVHRRWLSRYPDVDQRKAIQSDTQCWNVLASLPSSEVLLKVNLDLLDGRRALPETQLLAGFDKALGLLVRG
jgi:hypothetical protein